jgi:hypothetical protein
MVASLSSDGAVAYGSGGCCGGGEDEHHYIVIVHDHDASFMLLERGTKWRELSWRHFAKIS